jgi:hypothetical protein
MANRVIVCLLLSFCVLAWVQQHADSAHAKLLQNNKIDGHGVLAVSNQQKPSPAIKLAPRRRSSAKNTNTPDQD